MRLPPATLLKKGEPVPECQHAYMTVIPRDDVFRWIFPRSVDIATIAPSVTGKNSGLVVEVTSVGPGRAQNGVAREPLVRAGDVVFVNQFFVGHRTTVRRRHHYKFDAEQARARVNVEERTIEPIGCALVTRPAQKRMQAAIVGDLVGDTGLPIVMTDDITDGVDGDDSLDAPRMVYEEVVAVGPGEWQGERWVEPAAKKGQLVEFEKNVRAVTTVTLRGESLTIVPWHCVEAIIPG